MLKTKNIVIPAALGFMFSFFISIIATHKFGSSLLRGLLFCVVFIILSSLIQVIYNKFLSDGTEVNLPSEGKRGDKTGSVVDITIDDAPLERDDNGPQFFVSNSKLKAAEEIDGKASAIKVDENKMMDVGDNMENIPQTGADKIRRQENKLKETFVEEQKNNVSEFKPAALNKLSEAAKKTAVESKPVVTESAIAESSDDDQIDSLPEMSSMLELDAAEEGKSDLIRDSEFASEGKPNRSKELLESGQFNSNAETMAKAIQTLLKRE